MAGTGKSPLTDAVGIALTGAYFPVEMKFAGYDVLIVEGKAENSTCIWIREGGIQLARFGRIVFDADKGLPRADIRKKGSHRNL